MPRKKIVYNEDGDLISCLEPGQAADQVRHYLNWTLDRIPIDIYEFHCATPDVCSYNSKVGEVIGQRMIQEVNAYTEEHPHRPGSVGKPPNLHHHVTSSLHLLLAEGTDPLDLHVEVLRRRRVRLLPEMRMGDTHQRTLDPANPLVPQFALEHPEYIIKRPDGITSVALDYSFAEVREHRLAILREMAQEYEVDGLCLNFMRWAKYFERDKGPEKAPIMTEFVGQVRRMLDEAANKRGCDRLMLGVRALSTINECFSAGLDVSAWIKRGYVDYVTVCEHNSSWPGLNVEQFVSAAEGTDCEVYGQMGDMIGGSWQGKPEPEERGLAKAPFWSGYTSMLNTPEEARAIAHNLYSWGAQGIGFWNIPNNLNPFGHGKTGRLPGQQERILSWINEVIDTDRVQAGRRRYHYVPIYKRDYHGVERNYKYLENCRSPHGEFKGKILYFNEGLRGVRQTYPFRVADGRNGESLRGTLRFRILHCTDQDRFDVDINGMSVASHHLFRTTEANDPELPWTWIEIDLGNCPPFRGDNELGIVWQSQVDHGLNVPCMEELDMIVEP